MSNEQQSIRLAWSRLVANGTPHEDIAIASHVLPALSVVVGDWVDRLARTYLQELCRFDSHTKLVIGQYGSGKTHFLLLLALRALRENYAVAFVKCREGVSLDSPLAFYQEVANHVILPDESTQGIKTLMRRALLHWKKSDSSNPDIPDITFALEQRIEELEDEPFAFGRVAAAYLRGLEDAGRNRELTKAAGLWLQGEHGALTPKDRSALRLKAISKNEEKRFGNELRHSLIRFLPQAGVHGLVLLVDEAENMLSAKGKALVRVVQAVRTLVDDNSSGAEALPCLTVFAAVQDIDDQISKYQALDSRFRVAGQRFHEGADSAPRIEMDYVGSPSDVLTEIGRRLLNLAQHALQHTFDGKVQDGNLNTVARVVVVRKAEADARRLFVKAWCSLLEEQKREGERGFSEEEIMARVSGVVDQIRNADSEEGGYA